MKYTIIPLCLFVVACHAGNRPKPVADTSATVDTSTIDNKVLIPPADGGLPEIIGKFNALQIDSITLVGESIDSTMRFLVKGAGKADIATGTMFSKLIRTTDKNEDTSKEQLISFVVFRKIQNNAPFEAEILYVPSAGTIMLYDTSDNNPKKNDRTKTDFILVSKQDMKLRMIRRNDFQILTLPMATGRNPGNKKKEGDKRTPEGIFSIYAIHDASNWDYDFKDGKGRIKGTYGKYFIRFKEHYHIGIHGTHLPETVGSRATEGCVRLRNQDLERIVPMISRSKTLIAVTPAIADLIQ
jgi:lipoprotein-anchoring transpeptidase ErfK/SrfK